MPLAVPTTLREIDIPQHLLVAIRNENFLLKDFGTADAKRMQVFGTKENLQLPNDHPYWFIDGMFNVSPELYVQ